MVRSRFWLQVSYITLAAYLVLTVIVHARPPAKNVRLSSAITLQEDGPAYGMAVHDVGQLRIQVSNLGTIGWGNQLYDYFTGFQVYSGCEYPKNTALEHLYAAGLWVGAVVGNDTLVSAGPGGGWPYEFAPDVAPDGNLVRRSILDPDSPEYEGARSEQDFIAVYYDTLDSLHNSYFYNGEFSKPIGIKVTQKSYAWSYEYADDFVLIDLSIQNMDYRPMKDVYIGLYVDADIGFRYGGGGDICGFLHTFPSHRGCDFDDTLNLIWMADADADPYDFIGPRRWVYRRETLLLPGRPPQYGPFRSIFSVAATEVLRNPGADWDFSFNWWTNGSANDEWFNFGPQRRDTYRVFENGSNGSPGNDRERYFLLSNEEFDYDQVLTGRISQVNTTWMLPDQSIADVVALGSDTRYLLSWGPFQVGPYASLPLAFAYVLGKEFHSDIDNIYNLPDRPYGYYAGVDFSALALNARWAKWVYDNPGYDTDGDGYFGEFRVCGVDSTLTDSGWLMTEADTFWYRGDGIPDYRGASPPPAPDFWVTSTVRGLHIRFNGQRSETERDVFAGIADFEGYRIYLGRDNRRASFSLVASYDRENFDRYVWDNERIDGDGWPEPGFVMMDLPFTLQELRCLYGRGSDPCIDSSFQPLYYSHSHPYFHPEFNDSVFYFMPHDFNTYQAGETTPIKKRFPQANDPRGIPVDQLTDDYYTEDGYLKFFEYEFTIENLLPTVPYWVSVTAFDFGSPTGGVEALETPITDVMVEAYPINSEAEASGAYKDVYVYPNPYIKSAGYRDAGYEQRTRDDLPNYRVHTIHFTNLPPKCIIRIHSPDGDLVREINHDFDPADPVARDHDWHLVTQNHQLVVTGWYYWTVESPDGSVQIGKLAIIL